MWCCHWLECSLYCPRHSLILAEKLAAMLAHSLRLPPQLALQQFLSPRTYWLEMCTPNTCKEGAYTAQFKLYLMRTAASTFSGQKHFAPLFFILFSATVHNYFSEQVVKVVGVKFLNLAYLLSSCLPCNRRWATVEQYPESIQPKWVARERYYTLPLQMWLVQTKNSAHKPTEREFAKKQIRTPDRAPFFSDAP